jgi:hypothetical protein
MRFLKGVALVIIGLLVTVLFGCAVGAPAAAPGDIMRFDQNKSAASSDSPPAYDGSYAAPVSSLVSVNAVSKASIAGAPAVCAENTGRLDIFVRETDGAIWWEHSDGQVWSTSTSLGGYVTSDPSAVSRGGGNIDVFVRGSDGVLWSRNTTDGGTSWNSWYQIGGQLASGTGPAVCAQNANSLDVFVQGTDHALWYNHWDGTTWSWQSLGGISTTWSWQSLGGILTSSPAATSRSSGTIDVFVRGSDGVIWTRTTTNGGATWNAWHSIGGQVPSGTGPAADAQNANSLDVFVQGTDHALWYNHWDGTTWSGWKSLGGILTSSPAATSPANGVIDAFVRGSDYAIWGRTYNGQWSPWTSVGGGVDTGLTQGIANDGTYNYGISNTEIYKYDANWTEIAANWNAGAQVGVGHLGDACTYNGVLYIAACNWVSCSNWDDSRIGEWNTSNLSFKGYIDVSAQHFDAAGCGVDTADGYLWICSYCNAGGTYYKYNLSDFSYAGSITPSPTFNYVQGIKYYGDHLFVSVSQTGIIRMNINGTGQTTIIPLSKLNGGELEGLDVNSDYIRVLCGGYVFTFVNNY